MSRLPLLALLALAGCSAAEDPYAPRAGLWETRTSFVTLEGPGVTPGRLAALRNSFPKPVVTRECFDGQPAKVGDEKMGGRCVVTRISDKGNVADSEWRCRGQDRGMGDPGDVASLVHGRRGMDSYDYRITTASVDAKSHEPVAVVMREQGRRVGECKAKP